MLARYYSSGLARFLAVDPGNDIAIQDPQSWNRYTYVRNNPLISIDPDGRKKLKPEGGTRKWRKKVRKMIKALKKSNPRIKKALKNIKKSPTEHTIKPLDPNVNNGNPGTETTPAANTRPTESTTHIDVDNNASVGGVAFSPTEQLAHEISHVEDAATGTRDDSPNPGSVPAGMPNNEVKAIRMENLARAASGSLIRQNWGPLWSPVTVPNPTKVPADPSP